MAHVIFIHGVLSRGGAEELLANWRESLQDGGGMNLVREGVTSQMVYWADVLNAKPLTGMSFSLGESASEAESTGSQPISPRTSPPDSARFISSLTDKCIRILAHVLETDGVEAESTPLPSQDSLLLGYLRDTHHYLFNVEVTLRSGESCRVGDELRRRLGAALNRARQAKPPIIIVSHGLGSVVAYDYLSRTAYSQVDGLLTIGSPLGLPEIREMLPGWTRERGYPRSLRGAWVNVFDPHDPVAAFAPRLREEYLRDGRQVVQDIVERNAGLWRHDISKYLRGPLLRKALWQMLQLPTNNSAAREVVTQSSTTAKTKQEEVSQAIGGTTRKEGDYSTYSVQEICSAFDKEIEDLQHSNVKAICGEIVRRLFSRRIAFGPDVGSKLLKLLRRQRYFQQLIQVGDALLLSGIDTPKIRRQYAQGLIDCTQGATDTGSLSSALCILQQVTNEKVVEANEVYEAQTLIARVHKQLYVNSYASGSWPPIDELQKALHGYYSVYAANPKYYLWQGMSAAALLARAERDGKPQRTYPVYEEIAREVLANLKESDTDNWRQSTRAEALIALGDLKSALEQLKKYVSHDRTDAFELKGFLRQLTDVWQFKADDPEQGPILALLQGQLLYKSGGEMQMVSDGMQLTTLNKLGEDGKLEKVFGDAGPVTLDWYRRGLERCASVVRFETETRRGMGSGFVVEGGEVNPAWAGRFFVLTNAHVVSNDENVNAALRPESAWVTFTSWQGGSVQRYQVDKVVWTSPPYKLDATLVALKPGLKNCEGHGPWKAVREKEKENKNLGRVYLIGHPLGGVLSLSLQDNLLTDHREPHLRYRTPSEPGSSGSPVFDDQWNFIGLHHAGSRQMPCLDRSGKTEEANEGISLLAIKAEIARNLSSMP